MQKVTANILITLLMTVFLTAPLSSLALGPGDLVPCGKGTVYTGTDPQGNPVISKIEDECTFRDFIQLISNVNSALVVLSIPVAALMLAWIGWNLLLARGNPQKRSEAKAMAWKVVLGFIFILCAYGLVGFIANTLLKPEFNIFMQTNP